MDDLFQAQGSPAGKTGWLPLKPNELPSAAELKQMFSPFQNSVGGFKIDDVVEDRIYDTQTLTTGAVNNLTFFTTAGTPPTTNMQSAGQLPSQEAFYITGIKLALYSSYDGGLDFSDAKTVLQNGSFNFVIANKPYVTNDLLEFGNPLAPLTLNTRLYTSFVTKTWNLRIRQVLPPQVNFSCSVTTTTPTFNSGTWKLRCYLIGYRYRSIQ